MSEAKRPTINWMDVLWLVFLAGLALLPPVQELHKQEILLALRLSAIGGRLADRAHAAARRDLRGSAEDCAGHAADRPHRRNQHQQQLLADLLSARRHGRGIFRAVGSRLFWTSLASAAYCSYLFRSRLAGVRNYRRKLWPAGHSHSFLFSRRRWWSIALCVESRRQTKRYQELAETLAETNRRLEQAQAEARRSERLAALGAAFRRTGARDSQSAGSDQRLGGDADAEAGRIESAGDRTGGIHFD